MSTGSGLTQPRKGVETVVVSKRQQLVRSINHVVVGDYVIERGTRRWASLALLLFAAGIGLATFTTDKWFFRTEVSLRPDLLSGIIALLLVGALYLRRVLDFSQSIYSYLSLVLNWLTMAVLVQALLGQAAPWFTKLPMPYLIGFAIIMTWVGMRPFALLVWGLVVVFGVINIQSASEVMGLWGFAFITFVVVGILLQVEFDGRQLVRELRYDFVGEAVEVSDVTEPADGTTLRHLDNA